jgi:hypothetical protein
MRQYRTLLSAVALAVTVVVGAGALAFATGSVSTSQMPPGKKAIEDRERARQEALLRGPHDPTPANSYFLPVTRHYENQTGIAPFTFGPFSNGTFTMVNVAGALSGQHVYYRIFAGSMASDPQQGVLLVFRQADPPYYVNGSSEHLYVSPLLRGALTLTGIDGDTVLFRDASGATGRFNFVAGAFLQ